MFKIANLQFEDNIHFFYKVNNERYILTTSENDNNLTSLFEMDIENATGFMKEILKMSEKDIQLILERN